MQATSRSNQRRDLISLFTAMEPGADILFEEIFAATELDIKKTADHAIIYSVREHCRDVLGFVIDALPGKGYRRMRDEDIPRKILDRRLDRIHRQSLRGMSESVAVKDFGALPLPEQRRLLSHQAIMGTLALGSRLDLMRTLATDFEKPQLQKMDADAVIAVASRMKQ